MVRSEAASAGLTRYWTGQPCPRGHIADRYVSTGRCVNCVRMDALSWARTDQGRVLRSGSSKRVRLSLKIEVMSHYAGGAPECSCCGETGILFLTIDHKDGLGASHRRGLHLTHDRVTQAASYSASTFYRWLRSNKFPDGFQVLCFNCNAGRHLNGGVCPHQETRANAA